MVDKITTARKRNPGIKKSLQKRGIYLLPNLFTAASLFAGFYAIVQAMNGKYEHAAVAIFLAMVMDGLDGRVARLTNTQSAFGAEFDSLADMVSFGVAPALVLYVWALQPMGKLGWIAAFIYCACAALRLARFNTNLDDSDKRFFQGLPSPAAASLMAGLVYVCFDNGVAGDTIYTDWFKMKWVAWVITVFAGLSMISNLRFYSGKDINLRESVPFLFIFAFVMMMALISYSPAEVLFVGALMYSISGYVTTFMEKKQANDVSDL